MNILIEGGDLNPPFAEGTRNIAITHAHELSRRGHNVIILTRARGQILNKSHPSLEKMHGILFYRWRNYFDLSVLYRKIVKNHSIDLVHVFAKGTRPKAYFRFLRHLGGKRMPIVFSLLGWPGGDYSSLNLADMVITSSKTVEKDLGLRNSRYLEYGIDMSRFKSTNKKNNSILCLRFPSENFLRAFKKLSEQRRGLRLILNKKNLDSRPHLRGILSVLGIDNIKELDYLDDISSALRSAPVLVDTHFAEDLSIGSHLKCASPPLLVLEAMSCGVSVISNSLPEIKEVISNNTGVLIDEDSQKENYFALKSALKNNKKIGMNARKEVDARFNIKKQIIKFEEIYKTL